MPKSGFKNPLLAVILVFFKFFKQFLTNNLQIKKNFLIKIRHKMFPNNYNNKDKYN